MQLRHIWDKLRNTIGITQRQVEHTRRISNRRLGRHRTISDNLRHLIGTVFTDHIVHHTASTFIIKVNIDIGHTHTIRI